MIKAKLFFHTAKKFTIRINRHTCAFIAHQCHNPEDACREEIIHHRTTLHHTITIIA